MTIFKKSIALKKFKRFLYERLLTSDDLSEKEQKKRIVGIYNAISMEGALVNFLGKKKITQNEERDILISFIEDELGWED